MLLGNIFRRYTILYKYESAWPSNKSNVTVAQCTEDCILFHCTVWLSDDQNEKPSLSGDAVDQNHFFWDIDRSDRNTNKLSLLKITEPDIVCINGVWIGTALGERTSPRPRIDAIQSLLIAQNDAIFCAPGACR